MYQEQYAVTSGLYKPHLHYHRIIMTIYNIINLSVMIRRLQFYMMLQIDIGQRFLNLITEDFSFYLSKMYLHLNGGAEEYF